jgi:protein-L-isoaspartate(D-aspartate) O-methyltransferase
MTDAHTLDRERSAMLEEIREQVAGTADLLGVHELSPRVMAAMAKVPREEFIPDAERAHAYENRPLPIGHGQTISQPYIVAVMTELMGAGPNDRVLEVGTGCGYQAAVLAELCAEVETVEVVPSLAEATQARLERLGYRNVHIHSGNGTDGWPEKAPYRAIMVTAASAQGIPQALVDQLETGGRLVIPVEDTGARSLFFGASQKLMVATKQPDGSLLDREVLPVAFVPLV